MLEHCVLGQRQVMRGDFAVDLGTHCLTGTDEIDRQAARDVLEDHARARAQRKRDITGDHSLLGGRQRTGHAQFLGCLGTVIDAGRQHERLVLLVEGQHGVMLDRLFHCLEAGVHVGEVNAVIGESGRTGCQQCGKIGHFLALKSLGHRARLVHVDVAACLACLVLHVLQRLHVVAGRQGVRHAHNRGESARCRGAHTGHHVLFLGLTGVTEVYVGIDKTGCNRLSCRIKHRTACRCINVGFHLGQNAVVADQQIKACVQSGIWV